MPEAYLEAIRLIDRVIQVFVLEQTKFENHVDPSVVLANVYISRWLSAKGHTALAIEEQTEFQKNSHLFLLRALVARRLSLISWIRSLQNTLRDSPVFASLYMAAVILRQITCKLEREASSPPDQAKLRSRSVHNVWK